MLLIFQASEKSCHYRRLFNTALTSPTIKVQVQPLEIEAVAQRCSVKKVFFEVSQNLQENICARIFLKLY